MTFSHWKKILPYLLLFLWFAYLLVGLKTHSQSFYFQDETEHLVPGWMMFDFGKNLYTDLTSNHQPIPIIIGGLLTKIISYNTLFQLIERLRLSMWIYQVLIGAYVVYRFKTKGLLATIFYSSLSYYYFGWHILAKSLASPLIGLIFLELHDSKQKNYLSIIIFYLTINFLFFTLLPLWPFLIFSLIWFWNIQTWKQRKLGLIVLVTFTMGMFALINPIAWWQETVINNFRYFLPYQESLSLQKNFQLLIFPVQSLVKLKSNTARFILLSFILGMTYLFTAHKKLKNKQNYIKIIFFFGLLLSLNTRVTNPAAGYYNGFHLFPYLAGLSALVAITITKFSKKNQIFGFFLCLILMANNLPWTLEKKDKLNEYFINYGEFEAYGKVIKILATTNDTLITGPDGAGYINLIAQLPIPGRQVFHLDWAARSPFLQSEFEKMLVEQPPTFIYFKPSPDNYFYQQLQPLIKQDYEALQRKGGQETRLLVRKEILKNSTATQKQAMQTEQWEINF